jgi:hypothetical protein
MAELRDILRVQVDDDIEVIGKPRLAEKDRCGGTGDEVALA